MNNFLAIDQGTTSSRAIIFNSNLESIRDSQKEYELILSRRWLGRGRCLKIF